MQRIKIILFYTYLVFLLNGCDKSIPYAKDNTRIIQVDEYGKDLNEWAPKPGSIQIDEYTDTLSFVDSETGKKIKIVESYKIIYKIK